MSGLSNMGVEVVNPDAVVTVQGQAFAEVIAHLGVSVETLNKIGAVLHQENPDGANEQLAEVQVVVSALRNMTAALVAEHVRWAKEQGLQFRVIGARDGLH